MAWKKANAVPEFLVRADDPCEDYLTVLQALVPCNKKIDIKDPNDWKVKGYQNAARFRFWKLPITDIDTLHHDLALLALDPHYIIVYGAPTELVTDNPTELFKRRSLSREDQAASLQLRSASVVIGDIDTMILPGITFDEEGARQIVEDLVKRGLTELDDVKVLVEWTSKAAAKPDIARARIFAIMEEEATLESIRLWAAKTGVLDLKIYDVAQPIYIAFPTFENGESPIPDENRFVLVDGSLEECPPIPAASSKPAKDNSSTLDGQDQILAALYEQGMVKAKISEGKYDITCPWVREHTNQEDDGTSFMLPNYNGYTNHAFKCHHSHCVDKKLTDLVSALNVRVEAPADRHDEILEGNGIDALLSQFVYVKSQDKFYEFRTGALYSTEVVNRMYAHVHARPQAGTALLRRFDLTRADSMMYLPGSPAIVHRDGQLMVNLWKETPEVLPVEGDATPWLEHLSWLMSDPLDRERFLMWCAFLLQHQNRKINHALLIGGPQRIGKDTLLEPLKRYLGTYNVSEPSAEELKETYTDYLHHSKLVIFQECQNFDKLNVENKLKPMLAAPPHMLRVRLFGQGFYTTPNLVQCVFMSNHRNALKISQGDGRYYAIWCQVDPKDPEYYNTLYDWLENDNGYGKVVNYLLNYDVSNFNPSLPPPSNEYKEMIQEMSGTDLEMTLRHKIESGAPPFDKDIILPRNVMEFGGWEGVSVKRIVSALDNLGAVPRRIRTNNGGKREQLSLWAIRSTKKWANETSQKWHKEFTGEDAEE